MLKTLTIAVAALALTASTAFAAPVKAKVVAIDGNAVQVQIQGEKPGWLKKNAAVRITDDAAGVKNATGKVTDVSDTTITITTSKASQLTAGAEISLTRGGMSGC